MSAKFIAQIEMSATCVPRNEHAGAGDQAGDRQHQRQAGGDQRPECEHQDGERDRPAEQLGAHHRGAVGGVEVRPHRRGAGRVDRDVAGAGVRELALQAVGGATISFGLRAAPPMDDRRVAVAGDRDPARGAVTDAIAGSALRVFSTRLSGSCEGGVGRGQAWASGRPPSARSSCCRRSAAGSVCAPSPTPSRGLPTGSRQRRLDTRGERAKPDGEHDPCEHHRAQCVAVRRPRRPIGPTALIVRLPLEMEALRNTSEEGQSPTSTNSHWLTPTNAVSSRNQGLTSTASRTLTSVTVPAIANRTSSSGGSCGWRAGTWSSRRSSAGGGWLEQRRQLGVGLPAAIRMRPRRARTRSDRRSSR